MTPVDQTPVAGLSGLGRLLSAPVMRTLDLLLPPRCIGSGAIVGEAGTVSPDFWQALGFIDTPYCDVCGTPFALDVAAGSLCGSCIDNPPLFDRARAPVVYNDASRQVILDFKYGDKLHAVKTFVPWMQRTGRDLIDTADLIVPVPLHWRRLWSRRYNQAAILSAALATATGKNHAPDLLRRRRHTAPQKGLSRAERKENIRNAFVVHPAYAETIRGRHILLIDDVLTTGATLNECARVLKNAGASGVSILTIARVTREDFF